MRRLAGFTLPVAALTGALTGCELEELTLVEAEDVVVAEVNVQLVPGVGGRDRVTALLHRTLDAGSPSSRPVPGARIIITRSDGLSLELGETSLETCVVNTPILGTGTCYWAAPELASALEPGDRLELDILLADGGQLRSAAAVPGHFELLAAPSEGYCTVEPQSPLEVMWTRSEGTWAYVNETQISGLRKAFEARGIVVEEDPLYLLGLSISSSDTTIVFPGEFGVFNRFELDQDLSVALQEGLPAGAEAKVTITAGERNYVNWIRGGNFNPSGPVRVPSVRGDGTGVFAATVSRTFRVYARDGDTPLGIPPCRAP